MPPPAAGASAPTPAASPSPAEFDLEGLRSKLDEQGLAVANAQEASVKSRRVLAERTKGGSVGGASSKNGTPTTARQPLPAPAAGWMRARLRFLSSRGTSFPACLTRRLPAARGSGGVQGGGAAAQGVPGGS